MMIFSQDGSMIINYDNIIAIGCNEENEICVLSKKNEVQTVAKYETEKEATQILDEIAKNYELGQRVFRMPQFLICKKNLDDLQF